MMRCREFHTCRSAGYVYMSLDMYVSTHVHADEMKDAEVLPVTAAGHTFYIHFHCPLHLRLLKKSLHFGNLCDLLLRSLPFYTLIGCTANKTVPGNCDEPMDNMVNLPPPPGCDPGLDGRGKGWYLNKAYWRQGTNGKCYLIVMYPEQEPYYLEAGRASQWTFTNNSWKYLDNDLHYRAISDDEASNLKLPSLPVDFG